MIKHIVLSGGGLFGLCFIGALKHLEINNVFNKEYIESIYTTSAGSIMGLILLLNINWEDIINIAINQDWEDICSSYMKNIFTITESKGIFDENIIKEILLPFLKKHTHINENTTLQELYDITGVDFYIYTVRIIGLEVIELSHYSHPNLTILKAITMSSSIPYIFKPVWFEDSFHIDGGLLMNDPIKPCLNRVMDKREVISIRINFMDNNISTAHEYINIFAYTQMLFSNIFNKINQDKFDTNQELIIYVSKERFTFQNIIENPMVRRKLINIGEYLSDIYIWYKLTHM